MARRACPTTPPPSSAARPGERDPATGDYYLHYFAKKQPDLNWDNPAVREDVYEIMRFWLDKGVSGFRMDVIPFISKDQGFPAMTEAELRAPEFVYANGPHIHAYLQEMRGAALAPYDVMTVGEAFGVTDAQAPLFVDAARGELDMIFHFDVVRLDRDGWRKTDWTLPALKAIYARLDRAVGQGGWNTVFLGNHDNPRAVSHFGDDDPAFRVASAKALATLLLTQRGTPFLYQGDEIGMTNYPFLALEDFDDVEVRGQWQDNVATGKVSAAEFLAHLRQTSRDHSRTPMQWDATPHAGFTAAAKPWFPVHPDFGSINVAADLADPGSIYRHYQTLTALRRAEPALVYGAYRDLDPDHPALFSYSRALDGDHLQVAINFGRDPLALDLPPGTTLLNGSRPERAPGPLAARTELAAWEALVLRLPG